MLEVLVYVCVLTILYASGKDEKLPASSHYANIFSEFKIKLD